jgi:hypothetical protein
MKIFEFIQKSFNPKQESVSPVPKEREVALEDINGGTYSIPLSHYQKRMEIVRNGKRPMTINNVVEAARQQPQAVSSPIP